MITVNVFILTVYIYTDVEYYIEHHQFLDGFSSCVDGQPCLLKCARQPHPHPILDLDRQLQALLSLLGC